MVARHRLIAPLVLARRTLIATGVLLLAWPTMCSATMIVILGIQGHVVIAADSRQGIAGRVSDDACKIKNGSHATFIAAGDFPPPGLLEDVWRMGERLASDGGPSSGPLDSVLDLFEARPANTLARLKGTAVLVQMTSSGAVLTGAMFEHDGIRLTVRPRIEDWRRADVFAGHYIIYNAAAGIPAVLDATFSSRLKSAALLGVPALIALAKSTIEEQAFFDVKVGGAIDVLELDAQGSHWDQLKPNCASDR